MITIANGIANFFIIAVACLMYSITAFVVTLIYFAISDRYEKHPLIALYDYLKSLVTG